MSLYLARADRVIVAADLARASLALGAEAARRYGIDSVHFIETDLHRPGLRSVYERNGESVIPLTQEEIAEIAGTSRATVNRVLREDERRGVLELKRGRTRIVDPEQLTRRR